MTKLKQIYESVVDAWTMESTLRSHISDIVGEYPRQSPSFVKLIQSGKTSGSFGMTFTEEVKDGRSSSFNERTPLKLVGNSVELGDYIVTITDVRYLNADSQESDSSYSDYFDHRYDVDCTISMK